MEKKDSKAPKGFMAWDKKEDKAEMKKDKKSKGGKGKGRKGC